MVNVIITFGITFAEWLCFCKSFAQFTGCPVAGYLFSWYFEYSFLNNRRLLQYQQFGYILMLSRPLWHVPRAYHSVLLRTILLHQRSVFSLCFYRHHTTIQAHDHHLHQSHYHPTFLLAFTSQTNQGQIVKYKDLHRLPCCTWFLRRLGTWVRSHGSSVTLFHICWLLKLSRQILISIPHCVLPRHLSLVS